MANPGREPGPCSRARTSITILRNGVYHNARDIPALHIGSEEEEEPPIHWRTRMMRRKLTAALPAILLLGTGRSADTGIDVLKNSGSLDRLAQTTGVDKASRT